MSAEHARGAWALDQDELEEEVLALMAEAGTPTSSAHLARMMVEAANTVGVRLEDRAAETLSTALDAAHDLAVEVLVSPLGLADLRDPVADIPHQNTGEHDRKFVVELLDSHLVVAGGGLVDLVRCPDGLVALLVEPEVMA